MTRRTFSYTNPTLLPEAVEKWSMELFGSVLPPHLKLLCDPNSRFLDEVRIRYRGLEEQRGERMSLIEGDGERYVRMANIACAGSHAIIPDTGATCRLQRRARSASVLWYEPRVEARPRPGRIRSLRPWRPRTIRPLRRAFVEQRSRSRAGRLRVVSRQTRRCRHYMAGCRSSHTDVCTERRAHGPVFLRSGGP